MQLRFKFGAFALLSEVLTCRGNDDEDANEGTQRDDDHLHFKRDSFGAAGLRSCLNASDVAVATGRARTKGPATRNTIQPT